jgi:formylmethanofuran dehydrogenase subunit E
LLLHHPVRLTSGQAPDEGDFISVALEVPRSSVPMATGLIGPVCCSHCNEPISEQRLRAVPGVRVCTKCQSLKVKSQ